MNRRPKFDPAYSFDDDARTLGDRADAAAVALAWYEEASGEPMEPETWLADLLGDLLHWCDREGVDFDGAKARAIQFYRAERQPNLDPEDNAARREWDEAKEVEP